MPIERKIVECSGCREWYHLDCVTEKEPQMSWIMCGFVHRVSDETECEYFHNTDLAQEH